ncbi:hypothetical protein FACS1894161_5050 [Spirochaetia bacterium]|nr:hypothetical protein FACS1894161_5050 [Spirochaetia bacterium]
MKPIEPVGQTGLTGAYSGKSEYLPLSGDDLSFEAILNETCGRLEDRRNRVFLKRIHKMEKTLNSIEDDLSEFLETGADFAGAGTVIADSAGSKDVL